ncbi:DNA polymerase III subunit delta' [Lederbergia galactosidilytica]|uniref:DNA polymerase III subunit delta' n=1 Tax=Lederbergia galactosidilytica TaxID=217031 RepID=A0A177ZX49_9BACI|nr:DNA polymerase III subunit delta' [Lederbergia galactosidilytica]KRG12827.1 DNA polymerase III subunit delta' [Virgibacillus soli]MBP1916876.1 DNA polymerase-3 subunit delta' [Lederbergia galactosidilytica]OAK72039.1 DNA polymerase III subunit delta' [Lederbergia galactosidilytica]
MNWQDFEQEQPLAAKVLKSGIEKDRVAHAYLFEGEHGTGKRAASMLVAQSLFCTEIENDLVPCEQCVNCKRILNGNHPDVHIVAPDGLSIKIDQIRSLRAEFNKTGLESKKKFYIIIDAEKMTNSAANSLLKFLEEPYMQTTAILLTEQPQRILPTIISRCQTISFQSLPTNVVTEKLINLGVHPTKAPLLSAVTNQVQEALELNNDDWFAQARNIVLKLYEVLKQNPLFAMTSLQNEWNAHFKERAQMDIGLDLLLFIYKDILYIQLGKEEQLIYPDQLKKLAGDALQTSAGRLSEQMTAILEAKQMLQANMNPQLLMEQLVLKLQGGPSFV